MIYVMGVASFLEQNSFEEVEVEAVEMEFTQASRPRHATLVAVHADRTRIAPGETVPVTLELEAWRGARYRQTVDVQVPADAPDGLYMVLLGDGISMDAARLMLEQRSLSTFEQNLRLLRSFHSRRELQVFGLVQNPGLTLGGETLPQLPGSLRSIFAASGTAAAGTPLQLTIAQAQVVPLDRPIDGLERIDFEVRRK